MTTTSTHPGLGLFEVPPRSSNAATGFETLLSDAEFVEQLGFESYWVAEGHFSDIGSPSALAVLAAASQRTTRVRLGTAVIPLAFDAPLRVAETASVVNALSGDRLELGVGKGNPGGFSSAAYQAFGLDEGDREALYAHTLQRLREAFDHSEVGYHGGAYGFYPAAGLLPGRIWQATSKPDTARAVASAGDGLQLHRFVAGADTGGVQRELTDAYLTHLAAGAEPRIGVSRSILPAASREQAVEIYTRHLESHGPGLPFRDAPSDPAEILDTFYILHGSVDEIVDVLLRDAAVATSTDYLFSVPLAFDNPRYRESIAAIAEQIYPHLPVARLGKRAAVHPAVVA